jgi:hypothetical protein
MIAPASWYAASTPAPSRRALRRLLMVATVMNTAAMPCPTASTIANSARPGLMA